MKNYPLIKLIINILSNNSTRFFESYIKDFKLNLNNFSLFLNYLTVIFQNILFLIGFSFIRRDFSFIFISNRIF